MTAILTIATFCYWISGVVLAFLMATPYRLRTLDMFLVVLFWPLVILIAAVDRRGKYGHERTERPLFLILYILSCFAGAAVGVRILLMLGLIGG